MTQKFNLISHGLQRAFTLLKSRFCTSITMGLLVISVIGCDNEQASLDSIQTDAGENRTSANAFASKACSTAQAISTYCGFTNPEDIVPLPDGEHLLISEMGEFMLDTPGQLVTFHTKKALIEPLLVNYDPSEESWGVQGCQPPDDALFSPHGIDIVTDNEGRHRLFVVNHGGREAVEMFELVQQQDRWLAQWRGCAIPPGEPFINDVSGFRNGDFLVTHMWDKQSSIAMITLKLTTGVATGWVWRYTQGEGFYKLGESTELMPNGIALSADESTAYVNIYMGNKTLAIDLATERKIGEFSVRQPDNITRDDEGWLWVASHQQNPLTETCEGVEEAACLLPFQILRVNPENLATEVILDHKGEPMGYTTVATRVGDTLYMGSAHGDRIATFKLP
ncbi:MAG: SMP-30/gluconolactonase/LRE family protein [Pseudomonadales bacterium]|nr:SMP-30/gluconolactonase/LRE family protein [Pseudomonadales bacterium]MDA1206146.1 SMP-30/gluconolactonase/LRE family protein [Pseudomonadota bacterium]